MKKKCIEYVCKTCSNSYRLSSVQESISSKLGRISPIFGIQNHDARIKLEDIRGITNVDINAPN